MDLDPAPDPDLDPGFFREQNERKNSLEIF